MLLFSVIIFYSAIEIGPSSLHRKKMISAFKLNKKKSLGPGTRFRGKKQSTICLSQAKPFRKSHHFHLYVVYVHALVSAR